jgi:hypothetical protein
MKHTTKKDTIVAKWTYKLCEVKLELKVKKYCVTLTNKSSG